MEILIIMILLLIILARWVLSIQRKLAFMDENVNNAMTQIGVQLSSRFDMLMALAELTKGYAESQTWIETTRVSRIAINAKSAPVDVQNQENMIDEVLDQIFMVAELHPELKKDKNYSRCVDAVECYEKMIHTSCLIYNDSVTKLNHAIRVFPTILIAGILGFSKREYLKTAEE